MNQETINSLIRTVLTLAGAFLAGSGLRFFGVEIDGAYWQEIAGVILTLVSLVWSIVSKQVAIEKLEASIRQIAQFVLAIFATRGLLKEEQVSAILLFITSLLPYLQSLLGQKKTEGLLMGKIQSRQLIAPGGVGKVTKAAALIGVILCISVGTDAQSLLKKIHLNPPVEYSRALRSVNPSVLGAATLAPKDSTITALRAITGAAYTFGNNQAMGVAGIGFQNITYTFPTETSDAKKYVNWSINALYGLGGTTTPELGKTNLSSFGLGVGTLNNSIVLCVLWNKKLQPADPAAPREKFKPNVAVMYAINLN